MLILLASLGNATSIMIVSVVVVVFKEAKVMLLLHFQAFTLPFLP
jgi:hypothetical protein